MMVAAVVAATLALPTAPAAHAAPAVNPGLVVGGWGENLGGQVGDSTTTDRTSAVPVVLTEATAIAAGSDFSLALKPDGTVWSWGENGDGQLGDGTFTNRFTPVPVSGLSAVVAIAAGDHHGLALKADGTLASWGYNSSGALGDGTQTNRLAPVAVSTLTDVAAIAAGQYHSLALKTDGSVWVWGYNGYGQLGDGTTTNRLAPVQLTALATTNTAIAAGGLHSMILKTNGTIRSMGFNLTGQLGDGTSTARSTPVAVTVSLGGAALSGVSSIAAGDSHSLALKTDGTVTSWGSNSGGQLGDGSVATRLSPVAVSGLSSVSAIAGGTEHSLALKTDGHVWAWGSNASGGLGDGTQSPHNAPVQTIGLTGVTNVAAGGYHSLALAVPGLLRVVTDPAVPSQITLDGQPSDTYGLAYVKVLPGTHTVSFSHVEGFTEPASITSPEVVSGVTTEVTGYFVARGFLRVITSPATPATIYVDGGPREDWGMWTDIPVGSHTVCFGAVPGVATPVCQTVNVAAGLLTTVTGTYAAGTAVAGRVVGAWGSNASGRLGDGTFTDRSTPLQALVPEAIAVDSGSYHSLAVRPDGTVMGWGANPLGQIGDGTNSARSVPVPVVGLTDVKAVAAGIHSLALKNDGTVWAWGPNTAGQLGDGTTTPHSAPAQVAALSGITAIAAGSNHSMALKNDGTVWVWGENADGQLGDGANVARTTPFQLTSLTAIIAIAAGGSHSLAVKNDNIVRSWGLNTSGQLGDGTIVAKNAPVVVGSLTNAVAVAAGGSFSLALKSDGTVAAWGNSPSGQLGDGNIATHTRTSPFGVVGLANVSSIAAGNLHSLAIVSDGTARSWGANTSGQLGDGTTTNRATPVQIVGLTGVTALSGGDFHSVAAAVPGLLRVVTSPAVPSQILLDGRIADTYGLAYVKVLPGTHTVSFTHVEGFTEPNGALVTPSVVSGLTTTFTGTFTPRGFLRVITTPASPGTVFVNGRPSEDWGMWTDVPVGSYTVCFGTVVGKTAPVCQTQNVTSGALTTITGTYT